MPIFVVLAVKGLQNSNEQWPFAFGQFVAGFTCVLQWRSAWRNCRGFGRHLQWGAHM